MSETNPASPESAPDAPAPAAEQSAGHKTSGKPKKHRKVGLVKPSESTLLEPHQVILRPLVTEKSTFAVERGNIYTFEIVPAASKADVKKAVETLFDVRVAKVRTQNRQGKLRRYKAKFGRTKNWKKAIVELHEDDRISLY